MTEPIRISLRLTCPPERAFSLWTDGVSLWWPPAHTVSGDPGTEVVFEAAKGGRIFERTAGGEEIDWGRILVWEPSARLVYSWHLRADETDATEVDIGFSALPDGGCQLEIVHRGWERLGARGPDWRDRNRRGWAGLLPHFAGACGGGTASTAG